MRNSLVTHLSVLRGLAVYLLLILIPQALWIHSRSMTIKDVNCEGCSFLMVAAAFPEDQPVDRFSVNLTLVYEQVCSGVCQYEDTTPVSSVSEEEKTKRLFNDIDNVELDSDGGWSLPHDLPDLSGPCNIERRNISSLTQLEFLEKFSKTRPVILEGVPDQMAFKRASTKWRLLSDYGHDFITVATANTHSYDKTKMTLCDYVMKYVKPQSLEALGSETFYHFGDNDREKWSSLFSLYRLPPYQLPGLSSVLSFGLAGPGSGVPFHIHGAAFAETIFGRKRWFLYPPEVEPQFDPDISTLNWVTHTLPSLPIHLAPLQCTLNPGEVLYFPDRWWHATLNVDGTVFMSTFLA